MVSKLPHFWSQWHHEYLVNLREKQKLGGKKHDIKVADCVLVKDEQVERQLWKTGLIGGLVIGKDCEVRAVKLCITYDARKDRNVKGRTMDCSVLSCIMNLNASIQGDMSRLGFYDSGVCTTGN